MVTSAIMPILPPVETPDFFDAETENEPEAPTARHVTPPPPRPQPLPRRADGLWAAGDRLTWVSGLILALSSFMGWYAGTSLEGPTTSVIGWHTGALGKLIFFIGLLVVVLAILRAFGIELPAAVPESLIVIALGSLATIFVLIRLISIPDEFAGTSGRGIGIWISLLAALLVIAGGLLRAGEEL
jgi:hypothetical protein